jgi:hypothetical protein
MRDPSSCGRPPALSRRCTLPRAVTYSLGLVTALWICAIPVQSNAATSPPSEVATATEAANIQIDGLVTLNGRLAPANVGLTLVISSPSESVVCGNTTTSDGGAFTVEVAPQCPVDAPYAVRLSAFDVTANEGFVVDPRNTNIAVTFTDLTDDQLATLGVTVELAPQDAPLLGGRSLYQIVVYIIVAAAAALVGVVVAKAFGKDVSKETEAIVLLAVVIAVVILGVTAKISGDGLISVLSAIIGWSAGRATARGD